MSKGYQYSRKQFVRVEKTTGIVERKYKRGDKVLWKVVDWLTLAPREHPRTCPLTHVKWLAKTAV